MRAYQKKHQFRNFVLRTFLASLGEGRIAFLIYIGFSSLMFLFNDSAVGFIPTRLPTYAIFFGALWSFLNLSSCFLPCRH